MITDEKRIGLVVRTFATKPEYVANQVKELKRFLDRALALCVYGELLFNRVDVMIWADHRYRTLPNAQDWSDCGDLYHALDQDLGSLGRLHIHHVRHGDLFCSVLNQAVALQLRNGIDVSVIASPQVEKCFEPRIFHDILEAFEAGARACGVAVYDPEGINDGRIANAFAAWDNLSLMTVGGFDMRAAKPWDDRLNMYARGWSEITQRDEYYQLAGVEEVIPLARLVDMYGECIAPIALTGEVAQSYAPPDRLAQPEIWQRHVEKMATKRERQEAHLASIGFKSSFIKKGVLNGYGWRARV